MRTDRDQERKAAKAMGVAVSVFSIIFVMIWCVAAASMGAWFMLLFAIPIIGILVSRLVFMLRLAKKDPWDIPQGYTRDFSSTHRTVEDVFERAANGDAGRSSPRFCHNCNFWMDSDFQFCPKCGRRIF